MPHHHDNVQMFFWTIAFLFGMMVLVELIPSRRDSEQPNQSKPHGPNDDWWFVPATKKHDAPTTESKQKTTENEPDGAQQSTQSSLPRADVKPPFSANPAREGKRTHESDVVR
jgi:hypothetical protein